jgi:hypothetical protein
MTAAVIATNGLNFRFAGGGGGMTTPGGVADDVAGAVFLVSSGGGIATVFACIGGAGVFSSGFLIAAFTAG